MLTAREIEDCFPDDSYTDNSTGATCVSAQWLHEFAHSVEREVHAKLRIAAGTVVVTHTIVSEWARGTTLTANEWDDLASSTNKVRAVKYTQRDIDAAVLAEREACKGMKHENT